jgi:hypothetical protein
MSQKKKQSGKHKKEVRFKKEEQEEQQSDIPEVETEGEESAQEDEHNAGDEATLEPATISFSG